MSAWTSVLAASVVNDFLTVRSCLRWQKQRRTTEVTCLEKVKLVVKKLRRNKWPQSTTVAAYSVQRTFDDVGVPIRTDVAKVQRWFECFPTRIRKLESKLHRFTTSEHLRTNKLEKILFVSNCSPSVSYLRGGSYLYCLSRFASLSGSLSSAWIF